MISLAKAIRSRRESTRNRRDFFRAINGANPALRDEIILIAQQHGGVPRF